MPSLKMLNQLMLIALCSAAVNAAFPSSRIVYYLHTTPATWASARDTCDRYGARLVNVKNNTMLKKDFEALETSLNWTKAYTSLAENVWTGLHRFTDPINGSDTILWHRCETFSNATSPNSDIGSKLLASSNYCTKMDYMFKLQPTSCDTKLPYICQVEEGQCWFFPIEGKSFKRFISLNISGDLNTCAKTCRNDIEEGYSECWGFMEKAGNCTLYRDSIRNSFVINPGRYLQNEEGKTSYLKICTGGETTDMKAVTEDSSLKPTHAACTSTDGDADRWDSDVCYCDCDQPPVILHPEFLVLPINEKIDTIFKELKMNAKNTSASYRKLNSIEDDRPSAKSIGAAGIIIMAVVFGGLVLLDLDVLISHIWHVFCRRDCRKG